jgi:hypothetical protein
MSNIEKQYVDPSGLSSYDSEIKNWVDDKISTSLTDFEGATPSSGGAAGQVPAPSAGDDEKFLRGDGTWATPTGNVTGVKGVTESSYRTGNVSLSTDNVGIFKGTMQQWTDTPAATKALYTHVVITD